MGRRPILLDAWVVSRLRGEPWVALPLWGLAVALLAVPQIGLLLVAPALAAFFAVVALGGPRTERRAIEVTPEGVRVGERFLPRASLRRVDEVRWSVTDTWRCARELVVSELGARELERALRPESRLGALSFSIGAFPLYESKLLFVCAPLAAAFAASMGELPGALAWLLAMPALGLLPWPGSIELSEDGVLLRWLFVQRFIPTRELRRARSEGDVALLDLVDGSTIAVPTLFNRRVAKEVAARIRVKR